MLTAHLKSVLSPPLISKSAKMAPPTPPGFKIEEENITVLFVSGNQDVFGWHNAEYVIGWKALMKIILNNFLQSSVMEQIKTNTLKQLEEWAKDNWMGRGQTVKVDLKISEVDIFPGFLFGEVKQVCVN